MDWIDVLWTIAITEALLLWGWGLGRGCCFSGEGFHSACHLISSLFLLFFEGGGGLGPAENDSQLQS